MRFQITSLLVTALTMTGANVAQAQHAVRGDEPTASAAPADMEQILESEISRCGEMSEAPWVAAYQKPAAMTGLEWQALTKYIGQGFECVNPRLRRGNVAEIKNFIKFIDSALTKMPLYKNTVYRGEVPSDQHPLPGPGQLMPDDPAYLSTSTKPEVAAFFGDIRYEIHAFSCRDLTQINDEESEVLCPRDTVFRVRSIQKDGRLTRVVLDEEKPAPKAPKKVGVQSVNTRPKR